MPSTWQFPTDRLRSAEGTDYILKWDGEIKEPGTYTVDIIAPPGSKYAFLWSAEFKVIGDDQSGDDDEDADDDADADDSDSGSKDKSSKSVKTGDDTQLLSWTALTLTSLAALLAALFARRRARRRKRTAAERGRVAGSPRDSEETSGKAVGLWITDHPCSTMHKSMDSTLTALVPAWAGCQHPAHRLMHSAPDHGKSIRLSTSPTATAAASQPIRLFLWLLNKGRYALFINSIQNHINTDSVLIPFSEFCPKST